MDKRSLPFEEFQATLAGLLGLDVGQLGPDAHFVNDLGLDSLRLAELLLRLAQRGVELPPEVAWQVQTVGEAYRYYREQVGERA